MDSGMDRGSGNSSGRLELSAEGGASQAALAELPPCAQLVIQNLGCARLGPAAADFQAPMVVKALLVGLPMSTAGERA